MNLLKKILAPSPKAVSKEDRRRAIVETIQELS